MAAARAELVRTRCRAVRPRSSEAPRFPADPLRIWWLKVIWSSRVGCWGARGTATNCSTA